MSGSGLRRISTPRSGNWSAAVLLALSLLVVYGLPYGLRARALRRRGRPVPAGRAACYATGVVLLAAAALPALDRLADRSMAAHMGEHLLLGDLAPLFLVAGCTGAVLAPVLRRRPVAALRPLGHPVPAILLWALALYAWHLPALYDAALRHSGIHALEHASFFTTGLLVWGALLGPLPKPAWFGRAPQLGYVVLMWLIGAALGSAFVFASAPFYAYHGAGALGDQSAGGALMMVVQGLVGVGLFCRTFLEIWREAGERQELTELVLAGGAPVDERRIERAVAGGGAAALARRLTPPGESP
jgi:cytochrome c oxidase assembly factor CtaG